MPGGPHKLWMSFVVPAAALLVAVPGSRAQHGWIITDSSGAYEIPFVPGLSTFKLWLECCHWGDPAGVSTAEFDLVSTHPANTVLSFMPRNGFINTGGPTDLRLEVDGCPCGPVLAGEILVLLTQPGSLCIGPSASGIQATTNCQGVSSEITWQGLLFGGEYCGKGATNLCGIPDWPEPCCFPDGHCEYVNPIDGCPGIVPPIPCEYYDCGPTAAESESWGRAKGRYR
jgi:hypothetical protein